MKSFIEKSRDKFGNKFDYSKTNYSKQPLLMLYGMTAQVMRLVDFKPKDCQMLVIFMLKAHLMSVIIGLNSLSTHLVISYLFMMKDYQNRKI